MRIATIIMPGGRVKICNCGGIFFKHFENSRRIDEGGKIFLVSLYSYACVDCGKRQDRVTGKVSLTG